MRRFRTGFGIALLLGALVVIVIYRLRPPSVAAPAAAPAAASVAAP